MATTRRQKRVNELLKEELGLLLLRDVRDPRLRGVTVTDVQVSPDLGHAHVYISLIGDEEEVAAAIGGLERASGYLRHQIAKRIDLRHVPEFNFSFDPSLERGQRILSLLDEIEQESDETSDDDEEG
jgi:ribosome-binding factor A